jgi:hypothetical protein
MSHTTFTAEQLTQAARADMQQSELLRDWLQNARDRHCYHSKVLATGRGSYRACRDCGARLEYSLDQGATQRRARAGVRRPARGCSI